MISTSTCSDASARRIGGTTLSLGVSHRASWPLSLTVVLALAADALSDPPPVRRLTDKEATSHVLNRLAFGPRPGDVSHVSSLGWKNWVDEQLRPESINDYLADSTIRKQCPSLSLSLGELQQIGSDEKRIAKLKGELVASSVWRAAYGRRQLQEVVVDFWRNHFNVYFDKVPLLASHYETHVLREHAFGKFEDLLLATARHPAMLVYLDNYVSRGGRLNENYARELMELHTVGVDNGYTQQDVTELARTLTGWTCGKRGDGEYGFMFRPEMHDSGATTVMGLRLDGAGGEADGERAIRHLANHPNTARFISRKLCRRFIDDHPSDAVVERVADTFVATGGDLREVYRAIIDSPEFLDARHYRSQFKTPFEFVVSVLRTTGAEIESTEHLAKELDNMGQPIYGCVEPTGYYDEAEAWLDPGVMVYRWNVSIALVLGKLEGVKVGNEFTEEVLQATQETRTKKILEHVLPAVSDTATKKLLLDTGDIREMVALALGSAAFQQQ